MAKIIVVEDNESIRESIKSYLELENHTVYDFPRILGVMDALKHKEIDLLILDIMLPDGNGLSLAKKIRDDYDTPIIFLTARETESDRITGFEVGGDDYIVKPFSTKELVLRVKSILKRSQKENKIQNKEIKFKLKDHILDFKNDTHQIILNNNDIYFTRAEYEILYYLANNDNIVISRSKLLGECLDYMAEGSERTIDTHIKKIRAKLKDPDWIDTIRGYGYKFIGTPA